MTTQATDARRALSRDAYTFALARDPGNRRARYNVAVLDLHEEPGSDDQLRRRDGARRTLCDLLADPRPVPPRHWWARPLRLAADAIAGTTGEGADPLVWRARYVLAADDAHAVTGSAEPLPAETFERLVALVGDGLTVALRPRLIRPPAARFAIELAPAALVLLAGVALQTLLGERRVAEGRRVLAADESSTWHARQVRDFLLAPGRTLDEVADRAIADLVAVVQSWSLPLAPRTQYNLACLYATCSPGGGSDRRLHREAMRRAGAALADVVPALDVETLTWATKDPSLRFDELPDAVKAEVARALAARAPKPVPSAATPRKGIKLAERDGPATAGKPRRATKAAAPGGKATTAGRRGTRG